MPPPPAGTVIRPISRADHTAVALNWFSMSFGRKTANPDITRPSVAPARLRKKNVGFFRSVVRAFGISLNFVKALDSSVF